MTAHILTTTLGKKIYVYKDSDNNLFIKQNGEYYPMVDLIALCGEVDIDDYELEDFTPSNDYSKPDYTVGINHGIGNDDDIRIETNLIGNEKTEKLDADVMELYTTYKNSSFASRDINYYMKLKTNAYGEPILPLVDDIKPEL